MDKITINGSKDKRYGCRFHTRKPKFGVGINDADYVTNNCPIFRYWSDMLRRCYDPKYLERYPTYHGCKVCEEWIRFSKFKLWVETQEWEGKQLDKDLIKRGNKVYSPDTCCFISKELNYFLTERTASRGDYKIGVSLTSRKKRFAARIRNPFNNSLEILGYFDSEDEAHELWRKRKLEFAKEFAKYLDNKIGNCLIKRYEEYGN